MDTIRLFIGTSARGEDAEMEAIYEYTLRKNTKRPLVITWMRQTANTSSIWGGWDTSQWPTPFSGYRWAIPEVCNFKGEAIYTDVDMVNFKDIGDLWDTPMQDKAVLARRGERFGGHEFCVMKIDCAVLGALLMPVERMKTQPSIHFRYINRFSGSFYVGDLDKRWNVLDGEDLAIADMWQLHYTNMATQPWRPAWYKGPLKDHPRKDIVDLWYTLRDEMKAKGGYIYRPCVDYEPVLGYNIIGQ